MAFLLAQDQGGFATALGPGFVPMLIIPMWFLALLAMTTAGFLWWKKRGSTKKGEVRVFSARTLRRVWTGFLAQIPGEFRRYVNYFQHFIVLGEASSGKSLLISKYTDWKGQAAQFYPSYQLDPALQVYMGSRSVVQEIPPTLLTDTTPKARKALFKHWGALYTKQHPVVIVTLSAAALRQATPETLRTQAQTIRGKINVLSRISAAPIKARIVLTHMDQVEGYTAFSEFVEKQEIPNQIKIDSASPDGGLETCLEPFEQYLPIALTTLSARDYLKVLTFLTKAPATFDNLGVIIRTLREQDPRSFEPVISELYLTSDTSGSPSAISNPFATSLLAHTLAIEHAVKVRHQRITNAIGAVGLAFLCTNFYFEATRHHAATDALTDFEQLPSLEHSSEAEEKVNDFATEAASIKAYFLPTFFRGAPTALQKRFTNKIREHYILESLKKSKEAFQAHDKALYAYGLLYASSGGKGESAESRLGDLARARAQEFARILDIPSPIIEAYVRQSSASHPDAHPVQDYKIPKEARPSDVSQDTAWNDLLESTNDYLKERKDGGVGNENGLTEESLKDLQVKATLVQTLLATARQGQTTLELFDNLRDITPFESSKPEFDSYLKDLRIPQWLVSQFAQFDQLVSLVLKSRIVIADRPKNVRDLVSKARAIEHTDRPRDPPIEIRKEAAEKQAYVFDIGKWYGLLISGRLRLLAKAFMDDNQTSGPAIFLKNAPSFSDIHMRPPGNSDFLFPGDGIVQGNYTRAAWERVVRPQILDFEITIDGMKLEKEVDANIKALVRGATERYAQEYAAEWTRFYESWHANGEKLGSLQIILGQMRLPASRFQDFLQTVSDNTDTDRASAISVITSSTYQRPMLDRLEVFRPVNRILVSTGQNFSELEKYRAILNRAVGELQGAPPDLTATHEEVPDMRRTPVEFNALLTPAGRLAFAILIEQRDSYKKLVDDWLKACGIVDDWRRPFLEPIQQVDALGLADIETAINKNWGKRVRPQAQVLSNKFPFNREATKDAMPLDLEEVLLPNHGLFWVAFNTLMAPVCVQDPTTLDWKPMPGTEQFSWPKDLFEITNHLGRLTRALYNKDGVARPFVLDVTPEQLAPPGAPGKATVILSFLTCGTSSVFGFNQKSYSQKLTIEWAKRPAAQVGLQVGDPTSGTKASRAVSEPESAWSFYHLLQRDPGADQNLWKWNLSGGVANEYPVPYAKFAFKDDPWELFRLPILAEKEERHDGTK